MYGITTLRQWRPPATDAQKPLRAYTPTIVIFKSLDGDFPDYALRYMITLVSAYYA